ncbi:MAG: RidA family protein [Actinobacteria bacterium]|nr:MAG: RidA family protein [Actinomycetota bacterium]
MSDGDPHPPRAVVTPNLEAIRPTHFPWFDYARYTFSLGLRRGPSAWLSGHSASEYDPADGHIVVKGGMGEQTRTAYAKIAAILSAADRSFGDVRRVVEYVTADGIEDYADAAAVRREVCGDGTPAVCTVVVNRLLRPQALIEIEVTAGPPGDVVYLPSLTAIRDDGSVDADGDLVGQTRVVFEKAARLLEAAGLSMRNVVKTLDYTTPATLADYRKTGRVRKDMLGPVYPAAAGILLSRLQHPDALVSLDVIASRADPVPVNPGWERYAKLTYSPAVRAGSMLFLSGQAALDPTTEKAVHPGDVAAQAEYTYTNILEVLRAAGAGPENLVKTIEYVTPAGLARYRDVAAVRERLLKEPYPASTGAICEALLRPEFEIEIDPLAILD